MPSLSSCLITITTAYRNPNGTEFCWNKLPQEKHVQRSTVRVLIAECCYLAIVPLTLFETAISQMLNLFASGMSNDNTRKATIIGWSQSSLFSILWVIDCLIINPLKNDMFTSERVALHYMSRGYFLNFPADLLPQFSSRNLLSEP